MLSQEYLEFQKTLSKEEKWTCSRCEHPMYDCRCNRVHPAILGKQPKAGNPDNIRMDDLQNIKINKSYLNE